MDKEGILDIVSVVAFGVVGVEGDGDESSSVIAGGDWSMRGGGGMALRSCVVLLEWVGVSMVGDASRSVFVTLCALFSFVSVTSMSMGDFSGMSWPSLTGDGGWDHWKKCHVVGTFL